jgi:hypothetical protein
MTSSVQSVVKEDGSTPATPFDMGAGSIRANRAVNPTLVFNETYADFVAAGSDVLHRIDLNIPSIDATTMTGQITTRRTALNVSGQDQALSVSIQSPTGAQIYVSNHAPGAGGLKSNHTLGVSAGQSLTFWVTISAPGLANGQYFGRITLTPKHGTPVTIPVAFVKQQGSVTLSQTCAPTTFARTAASHCSATVANFGSVAANVTLKVTSPDKLAYTKVAAPASVIGNGAGAAWSGTLSPAVPPQVNSITAASHNDTPDGGYLALSLLGVAPVAGVGDDTISNFNVPTFYYGGEPYTRLGVVSNGYLVLGGGDSGDIVFTPQHFPNAGRPNNVLAPLWTDLNPSSTGAGAIRVATLSGGGFAWIVVDWDGVKNYGNATTHSFEVWLQRAAGAAGTGPASEQITYSYGPNTTLPDDGPGLGNAGVGDPTSGVNWGAENRTGTSGVNLAAAPADGSEWAVNTTGPTAGGTQTITYDVSAKKAGTYRSVAAMTSNLTPGTTQVVQTLTITH